MIARYDDVAVKTGAKLISCAGHDSIPWDLCTFKLHERLSTQHNDSLVKVEFFDEIRSAPSGGTIETIFESMKEHGGKKAKYDPLLKLPGRDEKSNARFRSRNVSYLQYSRTQGSWVGLFIMASVNS